MPSSNFDLTSFFKKIESSLEKSVSLEADKKPFEEVASIHEECYFIVDLTQSKITQFGGMKKLFGYEEENIDLPFVFSKNHPEDADSVQKIIKVILSEIMEMEIPTFTNVFSITSRFKKTNGEYLRILTDNFVIHAQDNKLVQSILIRYTDISFLDYSDTVEWKVNSEYFDNERISAKIYGKSKNIFTNREKEIISHVILGQTNSQISSSLNISKHTVSTHRKNIYAKSKVTNVKDLKTFCKKNGVVNGFKL